MKKNGRRTPYNYDGTSPTSHCIDDLLSSAFSDLSDVYQERHDLLLAAWPDIIGPKLAVMTQAVSFYDGILTVKVKNSTLHSLLSRHDKPRILATMQQKFPRIKIRNIVFRMA